MSFVNGAGRRGRCLRRRSALRIEALEQRLALTAGILEFPLPAANAGPKEIVGAIDGNMWFTLNGTAEIGSINTDTDDISTYSVPQSAGPIDFHGIAVAPDGSNAVWFDSSVSSGQTSTNQLVGSIDLATHAFQIVPLPGTTSRLSNIVAGLDGNLYFGEIDSGVLVQFNPATHAFASFPVTAPASGLDRISIADNSNISFTEPAVDKVGLFDVTTQLVQEIPLAAGANPTGLSGNYFTEPGLNSLARINPFFHTIDEYPLTTTGAGLGPIGDLFFGEPDVNQFAFFDAQNQVFHEFPIPSPNAGVAGVARGQGGGANVWFTEPGTNAVAEFTFNLPPIPDATITSLKAAPETIELGNAVTLTATVTAPGVNDTPFGFVDFVDKQTGTHLGAVELADGIAVLTTSSLGIGAHAIEATFSRHANFAASSGATTVSVLAATITTTTKSSATPDSALVGDVVTLSATVTAVGSNNTPTGSVDFVDTTTGVDLGAATLTGGAARLMTSGLGIGAHVISARYSGAAGFTPSSGVTTESIHTAAVTPTDTPVSSPTSPGAPTPTSTPSPTPSPTPPGSNDGPRVLSLQRFGYHARPTTVMLTFDEALDPASACNALNYRFVSPTGVQIGVRSVDYLSSSRTVVLHPMERLNIHHPYMISIRGVSQGGVADTSARLLDGVNSGKPGSDYTGRVDWRVLVVHASKQSTIARWLAQQSRVARSGRR
jgi:streptogramin lyase